VRDVAWDLGGSRSARFTVNYGHLELIPNDADKGLLLNVNVDGCPNATYSDYTGYLRYSISTNYVTFGNGYESYILGDNRTVVSAGTESFGRVLIKQEPSWVNIILNYRVRAVKTYTVNVTQPDNQTVPVSYVNIWIIKMKITDWSTFIGDFDLTARCLNVTTITYGGSDGNGYTIDENGECKILVQLGNDEPDEVTIKLDGEKVVFNFIVAEIEVST